MVSQKIRTIPFRRKRENKTDYKARLNLLKSRKIRFVVRRSLRHTIIQVVEYLAVGDKVLFTVSTNDIKKMGWKYSTSSIPCAYLAGILAGKKAKEAKISEGILDMGFTPKTKGSRVFGALKGLVEAGIVVPHKEEILPSEERVTGKHISEFKKVDMEKDVSALKNKILA